MNSYTKALRKIVIDQILALSRAGYQGSADKLEDALDRADAMVGLGPYATSLTNGIERLRRIAADLPPCPDCGQKIAHSEGCEYIPPGEGLQKGEQ